MKGSHWLAIWRISRFHKKKSISFRKFTFSIIFTSHSKKIICMVIYAVPGRETAKSNKMEMADIINYFDRSTAKAFPDYKKVVMGDFNLYSMTHDNIDFICDSQTRGIRL